MLDESALGLGRRSHAQTLQNGLTTSQTSSSQPFSSIMLSFWFVQLHKRLRACLRTRFGVPPLGSAVRKPPKGGTPNLPRQVSMLFFKQALKSSRENNQAIRQALETPC